MEGGLSSSPPRHQQRRPQSSEWSQVRNRLEVHHLTLTASSLKGAFVVLRPNSKAVNVTGEKPAVQRWSVTTFTQALYLSTNSRYLYFTGVFPFYATAQWVPLLLILHFADNTYILWMQDFYLSKGSEYFFHLCFSLWICSPNSTLIKLLWLTTSHFSLHVFFMIIQARGNGTRSVWLSWGRCTGQMWSRRNDDSARDCCDLQEAEIEAARKDFWPLGGRKLSPKGFSLLQRKISGLQDAPLCTRTTVN